jgi:TfoX/Sxy family transcriptional regulator of competence genes
MNDQAFAERVMEQLNQLPELHTEEMFGGTAIYSQTVFFAIAYRNRLYFRVTPATRRDFEAYGSTAFQPSERVRLTTYYEVPKPITDNVPELLEWARKAIGKFREE